MSTEAIKSKIKALQSRTVARGCSEAEALSAAAKAAELMREYGLDAADLVMTTASTPTRTPTHSPKALLWATVATCANCKAIVSERRMTVGRDVSFYGRAPGPEIAVYLFEVCENAIKHELSKFRGGEFYRRRRSAKTKRAATDDFVLGLVQRLATRLRELFAETRSEAALTEAAAYLDRCHPHTGSIKPKVPKTRFDEAANAGWQAGGKVNLSHGVNGPTAERLLIGGR